ncbi:MAG TPA: type II secretion system protein [Tepidisphaeraceae bacterium]|jgi:prepilin-type N-terminal cleavage/methylation domain-containing protein/prepilin-type processing-associated H-X9-DG protein
MRPDTCRAPGRQVRPSLGFTLVELLVVIGIIAVLISILLPALNRAREQAKTVQCLSNMRQLGAAVQEYATQTNGILIPAEWRNPPTSATGGSGTDAWPVIMVALKLVPFPSSYTEADATRTVFFCPSAIVDLANPGASQDPAYRSDQHGAYLAKWGSAVLQPGVTVYTGYAMNCTTSNSKGNADVPGRRIPLDNDPPNDYNMRKMSQLKDSADLVLLFDGVNLNPLSSPNRINARHNNLRNTNLLFVDGHAATVPTDSLFHDPATTYNLTDDVKSTFASLSSLQKNFPWPHWRTDQ